MLKLRAIWSEGPWRTRRMAVLAHNDGCAQTRLSSKHLTPAYRRPNFNNTHASPDLSFSSANASSSQTTSEDPLVLDDSTVQLS